DKAGNRMTREVNLGRDAAATTVATKAPAPVATEGPVLPASMNSPQRVTEKVATEEPGQAPKQLINSLHCRMEYSLDTPNVTRVEGYPTRDAGKTWIKLGEDAHRRSPFESHQPEDAGYGITLIVSAED